GPPGGRAGAGEDGDLPGGTGADRRGTAPRRGEPGPFPDGGTRPGSTVSVAFGLSALLLSATPAPAIETLADQLRDAVVAARPEPPVAVAGQGASAALSGAGGKVVAARLRRGRGPAVVLAARPGSARRAPGQRGRTPRD